MSFFVDIYHAVGYQIDSFIITILKKGKLFEKIVIVIIHNEFSYFLVFMLIRTETKIKTQ